MNKPAAIALVISLSPFQTSCGREEAGKFTLRYNEVSHVEDCHIVMDAYNFDIEKPWVGMHYVCGMPESMLDLKAWDKSDPKTWTGKNLPPLSFTMAAGDCLLLGKSFYCVESMKPGEAILRATFEDRWESGEFFKRIDP